MTGPPNGRLKRISIGSGRHNCSNLRLFVPQEKSTIVPAPAFWRIQTPSVPRNALMSGDFERIRGHSEVAGTSSDQYGQTRLSSEFQGIEVRSFVEVIDIFDSFQPQGYFECYRQQKNLHTGFCNACNENAFC
jgi:hypothetical protein